MKKDGKFHSLVGKLLISNPYRMFGDIFHRSVIYVVAHSADGAFGLIVNRELNTSDLCNIFNHKDKTPGDEFQVSIMAGGPIDPAKGFVVHSKDYSSNVLFYNKDLNISSNEMIISEIIKKSGPQKYIIVLGYTGWYANQLEEEIANDYWLIDDYDEDIVFNYNIQHKWDCALKRLGVYKESFISTQGHA